jgi:hypothetical protein
MEVQRNAMTLDLRCTYRSVPPNKLSEIPELAVVQKLENQQQEYKDLRQHQRDRFEYEQAMLEHPRLSHQLRGQHRYLSLPHQLSHTLQDVVIF